MSIKQLVYSSEARVHFARTDLVLLLLDCRQSNMRFGITGVLLHAAEKFVQCLEGPAEQVDDTYARIAVDARHHKLSLVHNTTVSGRSFADWTMACADISNSEYLRLSTADWEATLARGQKQPQQSPGFQMMLALWASQKSSGY